MKINTFCLLRFVSGVFFCLALATSVPARAEVSGTALVDAPPLDGLWKGPLKVPGGQLEVIFRFVKLTGGDYFCTLDVPLQKVSRMNVKTEVKGDTVRLYAEEAATRFVGRVSADGKQMAGIWPPGCRRHRARLRRPW